MFLKSEKWDFSQGTGITPQTIIAIKLKVKRQLTCLYLPCMDFLSDKSSMSNSLWIRSSMMAFTGSQLTVIQSTFS